LVIARFVPIVRTFAPFVAGVGNMDYRRFIGYCIGGGILWVTLLTLAGYFLGSHPFVKANFELVIFAVIGISLLPIVIEFARAKWGKKTA
jgi:membrane-associated protein